jgi:hypothetical protein
MEARELAKKVGHLNTTVWAIMGAAMIRKLRREPGYTREEAEAGLRLAGENGFALWVAVVRVASKLPTKAWPTTLSRRQVFI